MVTAKIEKIVAALAFSNRLKNMVQESCRWALKSNAKLHFIHIGNKTLNKENELNKILASIEDKPSTISIEWLPGDPVEAINEYCEKIEADLLILGALGKENLFRNFFGSIARSITRKAKCNVLLLVENKRKASSFKKVVMDAVELPQAHYLIAFANFVTTKFHSEDLYLVKEIHNPALSLSMADSSTAPEASKIKSEFIDEEITYIDNLLKECNRENINVFAKTVNGKPGYAISNFAKNKKADLLIINSPEKNYTILDRIFTHDLEYILSNLPCNLLIVQTKEHLN